MARLVGLTVWFNCHPSASIIYGRRWSARQASAAAGMHDTVAGEPGNQGRARIVPRTVQSPSARWTLAIIAAAAAFAAGCGGGEPSSIDAGPTAAAVPERPSDAAKVQDCAANLDDVVRLLLSGQPDHMFGRARDLPELVARADLVVVGTVESFERPEPSAGTSVAVAETSIIAGATGPAAEPVTSFWVDSRWADGLGPDPLATRSSGHGARFVAFLERFEAAPGGLVVGGQGLYVDCGDPSGHALEAVTESLPVDGQGMSVQELAAVIRADVAAARDSNPARVFDPDEEDDVPTVRNIWLDDCPSGIARQRQQGLLEPIARARTDWGAASQSVRGSVPSADQALSRPEEALVGAMSGTRWTIIDSDGEVRAIVETFEAPAGDGWGWTEPAICLDP